MNLLLSKMRQEAVVIPALSSVEDFLHGIIQAANNQTYHALTAKLSTQQPEMPSVLLANRDDSDKFYAHWLQQPAGKTNVNNLLTILDRLTFLQKMELGVPEGYVVNANRLSQLAKRCERSSAWYLRDLRNLTERDALLVAFSLQLQSSLIDQALNMFIQLYHGIFKRAKTVYSAQFFADGKTINQHSINISNSGNCSLRHDKINKMSSRRLTKHSRGTPLSRISNRQKHSHDLNFDFLTLVGNRYSYIRRFSPHFLQALTFKGHADNTGLRQAIRLIVEVDTGERTNLPEWTPTDFVDTRWKPYVSQDGELGKMGTVEPKINLRKISPFKTIQMTD